jgi:methylthioribulose-1-phosphate dehydratase
MPTRPVVTQAFAQLIQAWHAQGHTPATSSNFSVRQEVTGQEAGQSGFWVSRSGVDKAQFCPTDFIPVNADGHALENDDSLLNTTDVPSAETMLHADIYKALPTAHCVAHIHSGPLTVLSRVLPECDHTATWRLTGYELQKAFAGVTNHTTTLTVPIVPNSQTMGTISASITPWLQAHNPQDHAPGYLIQGHGLYTWATDLPTLDRHVAAFAFLAQCTLDYRHYGHTLSS